MEVVDQGKVLTTWSSLLEKEETTLARAKAKLLNYMKIDDFHKVVAESLATYQHDVKNLKLTLSPEVSIDTLFLLSSWAPTALLEIKKNGKSVVSVSVPVSVCRMTNVVTRARSQKLQVASFATSESFGNSTSSRQPFPEYNLEFPPLELGDFTTIQKPFRSALFSSSSSTS